MTLCWRSEPRRRPCRTVGVTGGILRPLLLQLGPSFGRCPYPPKLVERIHVERQVIQFPLEAGQRGVGEAVEGDKLSGIVPDGLLVGMEDMGPVLVDTDAVCGGAMDIASGMSALVNDQASLATQGGLVGKYGTKQSRSHNQIIVWLHVFSTKLWKEFYLSNDLS